MKKIKFNYPVFFLILFFILADVTSVFTNLNFYRIVFDTNEVSRYFRFFGLLPFILRYLLLCVFNGTLFTLIINNLTKDRKHRVLFCLLLAADVLAFLFVKCPQIFHAQFGLDQLYYYFPYPGNLMVYIFLTVLLVLHSFFLFFKNPKLKFRLFALTLLIFWVAERQANLFDIAIPAPQNFRKIENSQSIFVVSIDSLNAKELSQIQKYANPALREYLKTATVFENIISDTTQTHGSFSSIFSGKQQSQLLNRYPFSPTFSKEGQMQLGTLQELKAKGYTNHFTRDEFDTSRAQQGSAIDKIHLNFENHFLTSVLSRLLYSIHAFGLAPNSIAQIIFPWIFNNTIQAFGFNPEKQANFIAQTINQEILPTKRDNKLFFYMHTCILHEPVKLPFGYYPAEGLPNDGANIVSYADIMDVHNSNYQYKNFSKRAAFDYQIYSLGVQYLTEKYLNPLFADFEKMGLLQNAQIILMADHGETTWEQRQYLPQRSLFIFHGENDLYGSQAQRPLFISNRSFITEKNIIAKNTDLLNLSQAFRKELGLSFDSSVYSENAFPLIPEPLDLFSSYSFKEVVANVKMSSKFMYLDKEFDEPTVLFKQKTIFEKGYKLTLVRTSFGRRLVLCSYLEDINCSTNLWNSKKYRTQALVDKLNSSLQFDVSNNLDIPVKLNKDLEVDNFVEIAAHLAHKNPWLNMYGAFVAAENYLDFGPMNLQLKGLDSLKDQELYKTVYHRLLVRHCSFLPNLNEDNQKNVRDYVNRTEHLNTSNKKVDSCIKDADRWDMLESLDTLPREIFTFSLNDFLAPYLTSKTKTITAALQQVRMPERVQLVGRATALLERVFHYTKELNFKYTEANFWRLKYIFSKSIGSETDVLKQFLERTLVEPQTLIIEKFFADYLRSNKLAIDSNICLMVKNVIANSKLEKNPVREKIWTLSGSCPTVSY